MTTQPFVVGKYFSPSEVKETKSFHRHTLVRVATLLRVMSMSGAG